jgi:hypothetical protein
LDIESELTVMINVNELVRDVRWFLDVWELFLRVVRSKSIVAAQAVRVVLWTFGCRRVGRDRIGDTIRRRHGGDDDAKEGDAGEDGGCEMHLEVKVKCR